MDTNRAERLKDYVQLIGRHRGGVEGLLASPVFSDTNEATASGLESLSLPPPGLEEAKLAFEAIDLGKLPPPHTFASTEAIIAEEFRPAIDIVDGHFTSTHPLWTHLSDDDKIRTRLEAAFPSIGRIELPAHPKYPYGGTGFVVGENLIMTNRHVAEIFARGVGDHALDFVSGVEAGINFGREYARPASTTLMVKRIVMIHPYWDMALLAVEGLAAAHRPLRLATRDARELTGTQIAVVGYPNADPRNPAAIQKTLFGDRYGIKRLQPGELQGAVRTGSFGKLVDAAGHDCSTLGGNSGSALLDLASGEVLALHFGGVFHQVNYGVPAIALASDARVVDAGVQLAGTRPRASQDWIDWWNGADRNAGLNNPPPEVTAPSAAPAGGSEAMVEPEHDPDYSSRTGYAADFLGSGDGLKVPLPQARDAAVLAPALDGSTVLHYENFSLAMHATRRLALFTASNLTREATLRNPEPGRATTRAALSGLGANDREKWFLDPRMDAKYQLLDVFLEKDRKSFDKGHIVRREDVAWGASYDALKRANGDSYHLTNCSPQASVFNQAARGVDNWGDLENQILSAAANERLTLFAGPVFDDKDREFEGTEGGGRPLVVLIPQKFWKIVIARTGDGIASFGFVLKQDLTNVSWEEYVVSDNFLPMLVPIAELETLTGLDFGEGVRAADQYGKGPGLELVTRGVATAAE